MKQAKEVKSTHNAGYAERHWKMFVRSMKLDALMFKLFITDILFILTLTLSYIVLYAFWVKNIVSISSILGIDENVPAISNMDILGLWNAFITKVIIILILGLLLYILWISIYSAFSHTFINKKDFTFKLFLNFLGIYASLTLIYMLLVALMFFLSQNIMFIAWSIIILTMLYLYSLLIFYLVTNGGNFTKILHHGLKSMIRLHDTLLPLLLGFLLMTAGMLILGLLLKGMPILLSICALMIFLYLVTWLKRYMHGIIHEV